MTALQTTNLNLIMKDCQGKIITQDKTFPEKMLGWGFV